MRKIQEITTDCEGEAIPFCPTYRPTPNQFKDFGELMEHLDKKYSAKYGMVKISTHPKFRARLSDYEDSINNVLIPGPIEQNIYGKGGVYECLHIQKKSLTLKEYKKKTMPFDTITKGKTSDQVEDLFWKNISFSPPLYGADFENTLMEPCSGPWNLGSLDSVLSYAIKTPIRGVNVPYCYVGSWKTLFCWHIEDLELSAINYLHTGKSKFWYSIPANQAHILQRQVKELFPEQFAKCPEHLKHKTTMINPYVLKRKYPELNISKIQHKPGEFIIVFGGAYHCGFNFGFNIAQAINYATISWLQRLPAAKHCRCSKDSVKIQTASVLQSLKQSRYKNCPEFKRFCASIQKTKTEPQPELSNQHRELRKVLRKKISKQSRQIKYRGDTYEIDKWVQCDRCNKWRKATKKYNNQQKFFCQQAGTSCRAKQEVNNQFINL